MVKHIVTLVSLSLLCPRLCDGDAGFPFLGAYPPLQGKNISGRLDCEESLRSSTEYSAFLSVGAQ